MINLGINNRFVDYTNSETTGAQARALDRLRNAFVRALVDHFGSDADEFLYEYGLKSKFSFSATIDISDLDEDAANDVQSMFDALISELEDEVDGYVNASGQVEEQ